MTQPKPEELDSFVDLIILTSHGEEIAGKKTTHSAVKTLIQSHTNSKLDQLLERLPEYKSMPPAGDSWSDGEVAGHNDVLREIKATIKQIKGE